MQNFRITSAAILIAGALCIPQSGFAHSATAIPPHVPLQKTIGQFKTEVVPSLIVFNAQGASLQGSKLVLNGIAPTSPKIEGDKLIFDVYVLEGDLNGADGAAAVFIDIIGRPLTPMSYAGVARRTAYRGPITRGPPPLGRQRPMAPRLPTGHTLAPPAAITPIHLATEPPVSQAVPMPRNTYEKNC